MTISKGGEWGQTVDRPTDLRIAVDDADLARLLDDGTGTPTAVSSGDMFRTLGAQAVGERRELRAVPIDLVDVTTDSGALPMVAVAHVLARSPWSRGGWWRGEAVAVMNAEYVGEFDVAPRGHPSDGRVETFLIDVAMGSRQRLALRRRMRNASHLPHPHIAVRSVRRGEWEFARPLDVVADGQVVARSRRLRIEVRPDAAVLHA